MGVTLQSPRKSVSWFHRHKIDIITKKVSVTRTKGGEKEINFEPPLPLFLSSQPNSVL